MNREQWEALKALKRPEQGIITPHPGRAPKQPTPTAALLRNRKISTRAQRRRQDR